MRPYFTAREQDFEQRVLEATIGADLVNVLTPPVAYDLLKSDKLLRLPRHQASTRASRCSTGSAGGSSRAQVFRGKEMACYHKEWAYFSNRFKVTCADYIEAKPGIPPTPGHVQEVIALMKERKIRVLFASNYFDRNQIRAGGRSAPAPQAVIVPENTNGAPGVNTYFDLMNAWVNGLAAGLQGRRYLMDLSLFLPPLVACLVIVAIHSYLGLHVIAREVIFVDLSLAQMAALGSAVAILAGSQPDSTAVLRLRAGLHHHRRGALRAHPHARRRAGCRRRPSSASSSSSRRRRRSWWPTGRRAAARRSRTSWSGSLLWVSWPAIVRLAAVYAVIGVFHWVLRRRFLTISFQPETALANGWSIRWWDFLFYLSFGIVITFSVPIAGVLLVFSFLVVPAAIAFQFTRRLRHAGHRRLGRRRGGLGRRACWSPSATICRPGRWSCACSAWCSFWPGPCDA